MEFVTESSTLNPNSEVEEPVSMSADILELYRDYAVSEIHSGNEDFLPFTEWKNENKEVLS